MAPLSSTLATGKVEQCYWDQIKPGSNTNENNYTITDHAITIYIFFTFITSEQAD